MDLQSLVGGNLLVATHSTSRPINFLSSHTTEGELMEVWWSATQKELLLILRADEEINITGLTEGGFSMKLDVLNVSLHV